MGPAARLVFLASLLAAVSPLARAAPEKLTRFELENGLDVALRPVAGTDQVAIVLLFDIGEDHDPEGASGLAHMIEHLYVTAAAGDVPARTAQEMIARYGRGWNAQTGSRYTVVAFVVPAQDLEAELGEAAARMGDLRITQGDLDREVPRVLAELDNMFGNFPPLAVRNHLRTLVRPSPNGGRKGGRPEVVPTFTVEQLKERHARLYKPANARLVLAGGFDADTARPLVERVFAALPAGEPVGEAPGVPEGTHHVVTVHSSGGGGRLPGQAGIGWRAPEPDSGDYPAFLLAVARLYSQPFERPEGAQFLYTPLDDPWAVSVAAPVPGGDHEQVLLDLQSALDAALASPPTPADLMRAGQAFAHSLGTMPMPDSLLRGNLYGVAFGIGRRDQMGLDPDTLRAALLAVKPDAFQAAMDRLFAVARRGSVVVIAGR